MIISIPQSLEFIEKLCFNSRCKGKNIYESILKLEI